MFLPLLDSSCLHLFGGCGMLMDRQGGGRMGKKSIRDTRGRIISSAWKLFYQQGYENTTVEDIVFESGTSKGSFYHYFDGKDALLGTLAYMFDKKYEELIPTMSPEMDAFEKLTYLNHELFAMIDGGVSIDLLTRLLSTQLLAKGEKHLLDRNRVYFRLLRQIVAAGVAAGEFRSGITDSEIVKAYGLWERALLYDWCLCGGEYSLTAYTDRMTPLFLDGLRPGREGAAVPAEF
jgi:AcrR family transcriptional regulator